MIALEPNINTRKGTDGRTYVRASLQADSTPNTMPRTGEGIEGLGEGVALDVGSRLAVLNPPTQYVLGEDWTWYQWVEGSSGGGGSGGGDGTYFRPIVTQPSCNSLTLGWSNNGGLVNPEAVTIMAPQGDPGRDGFDPVINEEETDDGVKLTIITADGEKQILLRNGGRGADGQDADILVERFPADPEKGLPDRVVITGHSSQGTTEATVYDGKDGKDGATPNITITATQDGEEVPVEKTGEGDEQSFAFMLPSAPGGGGAAPENAFRCILDYGAAEGSETGEATTTVLEDVSAKYAQNGLHAYIKVVMRQDAASVPTERARAEIYDPTVSGMARIFGFAAIDNPTPGETYIAKAKFIQKAVQKGLQLRVYVQGAETIEVIGFGYRPPDYYDSTEAAAG